MSIQARELHGRASLAVPVDCLNCEFVPVTVESDQQHNFRQGRWLEWRWIVFYSRLTRSKHGYKVKPVSDQRVDLHEFTRELRHPLSDQLQMVRPTSTEIIYQVI